MSNKRTAKNLGHFNRQEILKIGPVSGSIHVKPRVNGKKCPGKLSREPEIQPDTALYFLRKHTERILGRPKVCLQAIKIYSNFSMSQAA